jgi:hypothetical protein
LVKLDEAKIAERTKKLKKSFTLPWWFKIFAYLMSFVISVVSVFFIVIRGISFGDEKCGQWLTSFIVSAGSSCLVTQPLQVTFKFQIFVTTTNALVPCKKKGRNCVRVLCVHIQKVKGQERRAA